ncbi:hypothetical protein B0T18DRAFT_385657 [Schizothecium vesticola]|uniref:Uncharacterized protein n=1 Tax=Schizothecium vesticola TaxID=314040 RepID=A0AA40FAF6_9PEZI|nr:hypothetical protein B0T18DRAFT_385657 [Schizothecium vesticola]
MAPGRSKGKQPARPKDETLRSIPTPKTQRLYNIFRQLEDDESQTPYASPVSSRTRPTGDAETDDGQPPTKKQKAQRQGPLDGLKRARAAFMREIGACQDCNSRKVVCSHFDRTRFEQQYQARHQNPEATPHGDWARSPPTPSVSVALDQAATGFSYTNAFHNPPQSYAGTASGGPSTPLEPLHPTPMPNGFVHTGSWYNNNIPLGEGWEAEIDNLEVSLAREALPTATMSEPRAPLGIPDEAPPFTFERPVHQPLPVPHPPHHGGRAQGDSSRGNFAALKGDDVQLVGIARKLEHHSAWECKHGDVLPGSGIEAVACNKTFRSLDDVIAHFEEKHAALERNWSTWKCQSPIVTTRGGIQKVVCCDTLWPTEWGNPPAMGIPCVVCRGYMWHLWQYGSVSTLSGSAKGAPGRVVSRDDAFSGGRWSSHKHLSAHAFLDHTSSNALWPGRDMGGSYCGSQRSQDPLKAVAHGIRQWAKQWGISQRWGSAATLLVVVSYLLVIAAYLPPIEAFLWKCLLWLASKNVETTRDVVFWGSLSCLMAGAVLMWWLLKFIQSRPSRGRIKQVCRHSHSHNGSRWVIGERGWRMEGWGGWKGGADVPSSQQMCICSVKTRDWVFM